MLPLLPFAAGLFAGAAAIGLLRSERARAALNRAEDSLRSAGKSGLAAARRAPAATTQQAAAAQAPAASLAKPKPARKAPRRKAAAKPATPRGVARKSAKAKAGAVS